ncbi:AraC family transcriptional regulator [Naasia sp. SYSU D00057]|uniref:AraC family transcriptional regulator n=1 Tax=Naasia sp. SYSU D00057 TaxID=2817380 RepID=UPI001B30D4E8|nr:AraC family transcriptional regulator [Naasia sp. SYSU D00057]
MTGEPYSRVRLEAEGRDTEQALHELAPFYDGSGWEAARTDGDYSYRYAAIGDTSMTLRTSRIQGRLQGVVQPGRDYVVQWILAGSAVVDKGRDNVPLEVGQPMLFPAHRPFLFDFRDYDQKIMHLERGQVDRIAGERNAIAPGSVRFDHLEQPSDASVQLWHDTVTLVSRTLARGEVSPLLWSELTRMTAVAFLEMYSPRSDELPAALLHPRQARLRAAVEHIHERAHLPVTVTELAQIAELGVRALQEAFQRELGMPPLAYLRQVRLDRVRQELAQADPSRISVAEVAGRWGFAHLGRFAAAYFRRFGEYPKETLHG